MFSLPWYLSGKESASQCLPLDQLGFNLKSGRSLEKKLATHSRILAWEIWTEKPRGLQSIQEVAEESDTT